MAFEAIKLDRINKGVIKEKREDMQGLNPQTSKIDLGDEEESVKENKKEQ